MIYEAFVSLILIAIIALAIIAVIWLSQLDTIDTDDATVSVVATADGASLSNSPVLVLQFVTPGNGVIMNISGFGTGNLVGANSILQTQTPLPDDIWPAADLDFPILVTNNGTTTVGRLSVLSTGILRIYSGPNTTNLFTIGTINILNTAVSWTHDLS